MCVCVISLFAFITTKYELLHHIIHKCRETNKFCLTLVLRENQAPKTFSNNKHSSILHGMFTHYKLESRHILTGGGGEGSSWICKENMDISYSLIGRFNLFSFVYIFQQCILYTKRNVCIYFFRHRFYIYKIVATHKYIEV